MYHSILYLLLLCWPFAIYSDYLFSPKERGKEKKKKKKKKEEEEEEEEEEEKKKKKKKEKEEMSIGKFI